MNTSFYNGVIGIKTHQTGIDLVSENISNLETTAYKSVEPDFSTIFSTVLNGGYSDSVFSDIGLGSSVVSTTVDLSQGSLLSTDNNFDMAIEGEGWFGVQKGDETFFTRDGSFTLDDNGDLVNAKGYYLLGTPANNIAPITLSQDKLDKFGQIYQDGAMSNEATYQILPTNEIDLASVDSQSKINLPDILYYPPVPTTKIDYKANLDPTILTKIDPSTGEEIEIPNVEHFTTYLISPEGKRDILDMTFTKRIPQQQSGSVWDATIQILEDSGIKYDPDTDYDTTKYKIDENRKIVYQIVDSQTGVLSFDYNGALVSNTIPTLSNSGVALNLNLGTPLDSSVQNSGYNGLTSLKDNNFTESVRSNGKVEGFLTNYGVNENGEVVAEFTNGESVPIAKIGVYHFQNDEGLYSVGGSLFQESANSGKPIFYEDDEGNFFNNSKIASGKLEEGNVSLSNALTELIVLQKAYDANAKSITTSDQMIQKAINMKT
ncbi:MAG: flagellar hook protein FlgE [Epsilonproteobacteria bacterium]|nr:flagellar hook protein FlgE [Campylobacterota bacterium]